jgi:hypothetical protein
MSDEKKKESLRASALPLSLLAEAMRTSAVKNGELDLYRTARELRADLANAGALITTEV